MKIDRKLQQKILQVLRNAYPARVGIQNLPTDDQLRATLWYLAEHGLIDVLYSSTFGDPTAIRNPRITAEGLDFLEDDGGVSAMLRTVTVKLDPDNLRALLAARAESSDLPADEKRALPPGNGPSISDDSSGKRSSGPVAWRTSATSNTCEPGLTGRSCK